MSFPRNLVIVYQVHIGRRFQAKVVILRKGMAEKGGFEPPLRVTVNTISNRAVSTTHPPLRRAEY
jgi:hypothetical protein